MYNVVLYSVRNDGSRVNIYVLIIFSVPDIDYLSHDKLPGVPDTVIVDVLMGIKENVFSIKQISLKAAIS